MDKTYGDDYNKDFDTFEKTSAAITLASAFVGSIGSAIANRNEKRAYEIYNAARDRYMSAFRMLEDNTKRTRATITNVVCLKKQIMCSYMSSFLKAYRRLAPQIQLKDSQGLGELQRFVFGQEEFGEVEMKSTAYLSFNIQKLGEKAEDVALHMVQDGTISDLAHNMKDVVKAAFIDDYELRQCSMDNLKVQSIGILAQFSTVAVGFGISSVADAFTSGKQVNRAKEVAAQLNYQIEEIKSNIDKINAIDQYANIHFKLLNRFAPLMEEYVARSVKIIKNRDNIFHFGRIQERKFTQNEIEVLAFTFSLVGAVKAVIDSPIISQNGEVFDGNKTDFDMAQNCVGTFERKCLEMRA